MKLSLNCLVLGRTSDNVITKYIGEESKIDDVQVKFDQLTVAGFKKLLREELGGITDMDLWKVDGKKVEEEENNLKEFTVDDIKNKLGGEKMTPRYPLEDYFKETDTRDNRDIRVFIVSTSTELGRKRRNTEEETTGRKRRSWAVNSTIIDEVRDSVYFVDPTETSGPLYDMIQRGEFVALYGARASGKSTRVDQAMIKLKSKGYVCIYISFEGVNMSTMDIFWSSIGTKLAINAPKYFELNDVKSVDDFMFKFRKSNWESEVVFFIDEYDTLLGANDDVRTSFLGAIRNIKNSKRDYAIWSSVAIGPLSILFLKSDKINISPFNVKEPFRNPNFTLAQVESVYKDYEDDNILTIVPEVIKDIYERTNGHAGLVCLCGKAINHRLEEKLDERRCLDFTLWSNFVASSRLVDRMIMYSTFKKMVDDLLTPYAKKAMDLLRSAFLGFFDFVPIQDTEERRLADFLTAEGVLMREDENEFSYRMSSIFVDELIRLHVIPVVYKSCPDSAIPKKDDHSLDILNILRTAIQFFDKDIIFNAFDRSYKVADELYVNGKKKSQVPRESVYDTELCRILVNWLVKRGGINVTGQWHMVGNRGEHSYSDIVITTDRQKIVLELLATATEKNLEEHFKRVLKYAKLLSAGDVWIVHFTCEDGYATQELQWPSNDRINTVHFFHDRMLNVLMNARYANSAGTIEYIVDQAVP